MTVNEQLMGLGSWGLTLREETPREVLDRLLYFGHVAIIPGKLAPAEYGDNLLSMAKYVGVLTKRESDDVTRIGGQGMALWLGDSDGKGEVFESPQTITGQTFANTITALMSGSTAVVVGTLYSVAGTYSGVHVWQSRGKAVDYVCQTMGAEWRVNGTATLDAGPIANLFKTTPDCLIVRKGAGKDLTVTGLSGDMQLSRDVEDFTTRVVLLAEGEGESTATAAANILSNPYLDIRGNAVKRVRLVSESGTSTGNAQARAQLQLNRFTGTRNALRLSAQDIEVDGSFEVGDYVFVWDPDAGLFDTNNELMFRGQRINPIKLRAVEASWPVTKDMTVAYRHQDGSWIDLTSFFVPETGGTSIGVGELNRSLTNAGSEPVGPRPIPDSTIPGTVAWDLPFTTGVYLDGLGNTRARILVNWLLPTNVDGSTVLDGSHYEIRYGVNPASEWQVEFAPWGSLQQQILDLSPGVDYDFQIRAVDLYGNQGAWSVTETATANPDTIAPSTPAPPTVAGSRLAIQIVHTLGKASGGTYNLELDLDHFEVHVGASSGFTPDSTTLKGKVSAHAGMIVAGIPAVGTVDVEETSIRYVKVIAVDQSGNRSSASTAATATALLIDSAHISDLTASKITAGTIGANIIVGARIATALTGTRVELNTDGLQAYNASGVNTVDVDSSTGEFALRTATSGERMLIGPTGLQTFNSSVRTVNLGSNGTFEIRSAASGSRIHMDGTGFYAYNSSNQQTVSIPASSGAPTFVGQISTGFSGNRIIFNPTGSPWPSIYFTPASGTNYASIQSQPAVNNNITIFMDSSTDSSTQHKSVASVVPDFFYAANWRTASVGDYQSELWLKEDEIRLEWRGVSSPFNNHQLRCTDSGWTVDGTPIKSFIIDHPQHADRWLVHACTESPQAGVEYWGETTLDQDGRADITLPDYFEALTLTDGRAVAVNSCSDEIRNASATYPTDGAFRIHGAPGVRVTWIVKAVRRDAAFAVEPRRDEIDVHGDGPYRYSTIKEPA